MELQIVFLKLKHKSLIILTSVYVCVRDILLQQWPVFQHPLLTCLMPIVSYNLRFWKKAKSIYTARDYFNSIEIPASTVYVV